MFNITSLYPVIFSIFLASFESIFSSIEKNVGTYLEMSDKHFKYFPRNPFLRKVAKDFDKCMVEIQWLWQYLSEKGFIVRDSLISE
jgi:hypothetical protein